MALKNVAALTLVLAGWAHADACFDYREIELRGSLTSETFPGPPSYESVAAGDRLETHFFIVPRTAICVAEGNDLAFEPGASNVERIQLIFPDASSYRRLRPLLGRGVSCRGVLMGQLTGHHHSRVLLTNARCSAAESMALAGEPQGAVAGATEHGEAVNPSASEALCASASTQAEMNRCAHATADRADASLAKFIASYEARLSPGQVRRFQKSQTAWERFRRSACKFESAGTEGGSAQPMVVASCMASKARDRLDELRKAALCKEGDLGCPATR